jgi:hypothetical protein
MKWDIWDMLQVGPVTLQGFSGPLTPCLVNSATLKQL